MVPALTVNEIEDEVRNRLSSRPVDAIILAFVPYDGNSNSEEAAYLRRWNDYNFHSGQYVDAYNVGYAMYDDNRPDDIKVDVSEFFRVRGYFYPRLFHEVRAFISQSTCGEWNYAGGVDFLFFSTKLDNSNRPVDWSQAIALRSNDLVPSVFRDVDELARTVFNLAQAKYGRFEPSDFSGEVGRLRLRRRLSGLGSSLGPKVAELGAKLLIGKSG